MNTLSYWLSSTSLPEYPELQEDITTDAAIIGGGLAGITTAYLLTREGLKTTVLEAKHLGFGATAYTTAKITSQHSLIYDRLLKNSGREKAKQYAEANESALRMMADIIEREKINCDLSRQPAYVFTQAGKYVKSIENEVQAAQDLGIKASYKNDLPLPIVIKAAVCFEEQAQYHPLKYLLALAEKTHAAGGSIFEKTRAKDIEKKGAFYEMVTENGHRLKAPTVIIATRFPFYDKPGLYYARLYQERSYIVAVKAKESFPGGMYINAEQPTRSLRAHPCNGGELVLFVGEDHKTGQGKDTKTHYANLADYAHRLFTVEEVSYQWSTQDCLTLDGIPYIGQLAPSTPGIYVATGFGKWGMTNSTAAAMIIRDLITKNESPWAAVYDPLRVNPVASAKNFIMNSTDMAEKLIAGKFSRTASDVELKPHEGRIVMLNGKKTGVYRDEEERHHYVDITCTHMGCSLKWNDAEETWDCPCHGSRFSYTGEVIATPATEALAKRTPGEKK